MTNENNNKSHGHWFILIFSILGLVAIFTPIQHFIEIGRAQHHGIAIGIFGLGFWIESILAAKDLNKWAKRSFFAAGLFFISVGIVFYKNTWLYSNVAIQTEENLQMKGFMVGIYLTAAIIVAATWVKWILEEHKARKNSGSESATKSEEDQN